jgi:hypothetical protein
MGFEGGEAQAQQMLGQAKSLLSQGQSINQFISPISGLFDGIVRMVGGDPSQFSMAQKVMMLLGGGMMLGGGMGGGMGMGGLGGLMMAASLLGGQHGPAQEAAQAQAMPTPQQPQNALAAEQGGARSTASGFGNAFLNSRIPGRDVYQMLSGPGAAEQQAVHQMNGPAELASD